MEFGIFSVSDVTRDPVSGETPSEAARIHGLAEIAVHAEEVGFDVFAVGEHHNAPFFSSSPTTFLAYIAAMTKTLKLSTSTTLITTNDPVRIAEEYAMLQHLAGGRVGGGRVGHDRPGGAGGAGLLGTVGTGVDTHPSTLTHRSDGVRRARPMGGCAQTGSTGGRYPQCLWVSMG